MGLGDRRAAPRRPDRGSSARRARLYGDAFDALWGELVAGPGGERASSPATRPRLRCFPSPGHASHHVCYFRDGTLSRATRAGVRIQPARIRPARPRRRPTSTSRPGSARSTRSSGARPSGSRSSTSASPTTPRATSTSSGERLDALGRARRRRRHRGGVGRLGDRRDPASGEDRVEEFDVAMPLTQSYAGLRRYWDKKREAAA